MSPTNAPTQMVPDFVADLDLYADEQGERRAILPGFRCQCLLAFDQQDPVIAYDARVLVGAERLRCGESRRVGFVCLTDEGATVLATAGKFLVIETRLVGDATVVPGSFDTAIYQRSEREIDDRLEHFRRLGTDYSGWRTLYKDTEGNCWEVSYPIGGMHGGGPRRLARLESRHLEKRYPRSLVSRADG